jgi:hypothetical protein
MNHILESVCSVCNSIRSNTKSSISFQQLLFTIRKEFRKKSFELRILTRRKDFLDFDEYYVNAYYDAVDDESSEIPIEIIIFHNFDYSTPWNKLQITQLLIQIYDALIHEFKHRAQSQKRNYQIFWHGYSYLEDPDEIDAYAFSISIELSRSLGKYRAIRCLSRASLLSTFRFQEFLVSPNLYAYLLEYKTSDKVIKSLLKKTYKYLQIIDIDAIFL